MKQDNYREFICGYGAAVTSVAITFPVSKVIFRQMLHGVGVRHAIDQLKNEGFFSLYRGILPPMLQKSTSMALMFGTFDQFYRHLCKATPDSSRYVHFSFIWVAAAASAGVECILVPFERIQTLLQDPDYHSRFQNTFHAAKELYSYKLREYYRGITAIYLRNSLSTGLFFSLREPIANTVLGIFQQNGYCKHPDTKLNSSDQSQGDHVRHPKLVPVGAAHFVSGAILGASLSTFFYPINVIRARMQSYVGGEFHNIIAVWRIIRAERSSFIDMWKGVPLNFSRSLISWGIINSTYELLKTVFFPDASSSSNAENPQRK